jgi:hypothetical protein
MRKEGTNERDVDSQESTFVLLAPVTDGSEDIWQWNNGIMDFPPNLLSFLLTTGKPLEHICYHLCTMVGTSLEGKPAHVVRKVDNKCRPGQGTP